ncbi:MAG TPA: tetratricopeptide repeat protein [Xanthobacteraceae bacterium]|nr:tetratricopeptide repeat protein [Xanthobacteraceae bacterium]
MTAKSGPFNPGAALGEAVALHRQGRLHEAEKIYARVLKAVPGNFDALNLLGSIKARLGHLGEAKRLFSGAVKADPRAPQAWSNLGQAHYALNNAREALECFDKARALAPDDADILYQHANALLSLDRPREALAEFQAVLARIPQHVEARINSGLAQAALGSGELALAEFEAALTLLPHHPIAHFNRGVALLQLGRYQDAVAANEAATAAMPDHIGAWLNRGRALSQLRRFDEAAASYGEVLARRKNHADAHFNRSLALLTLGQYRRGFEDYEWRWRRTGIHPQKSRGRPLWLGEYPLHRKTVLLHAEQGLGDTIQFARYVPLLAAGGATVVLEVQAELKSLMSGLGGATRVLARGEAPPPFDVHCPLGSLPLAMKTEIETVPAPIPYLAADADRVRHWSARIDALPRPRIAVAWSGNPAHENDRNRSIPFAALAPLFAVPAGFVSIQRDVRDADAAQVPAQRRLTHLGGELEDFSDTAAVLSLCDLVVTADTAPAHLAGALGRPLWVLVPFAPDWRWMPNGETTPWYPSARLFRQTSLDDWATVIGRVADALRSGAIPFADKT